MKRKQRKSYIRKQLQKRLEQLWKEYAIKRDKTCKLCDSKLILQVHHIFSRKIKRLFFDTENSITLCRRCHCAVTWNDTAKDSLRRKIDTAIYDRLYEQSLDKSPFLEVKNISWLEAEIKILEELIN